MIPWAYSMLQTSNLSSWENAPTWCGNIDSASRAPAAPTLSASHPLLPNTCIVLVFFNVIRSVCLVTIKATIRKDAIHTHTPFGKPFASSRCGPRLPRDEGAFCLSKEFAHMFGLCWSILLAPVHNLLPAPIIDLITQKTNRRKYRIPWLYVALII